jgi:hypothetical protein
VRARADGHTVSLRPPAAGNVTALARSLKSAAADDARSGGKGWHANFIVARKLGIDSSVLGRITGTCRVTVGEHQIDVGLGLRSGADLAVPDFARPAPEGAQPPPPAVPSPTPPVRRPAAARLL